MITDELINPNSIVVVGGSNNVKKPGGKVLKNIIDHEYKGNLYVINPKETEVQGITSYQNPENLPEVDLAIIAIAAKHTPEIVESLASQKNTRGFIILSAGYSEESENGKKLEDQIVEIVKKYKAALIGPNCIGVMNSVYAGVFTTPIPKFDTGGVDFISGSGATAVFIIESGVTKGLRFSSVYSVGNSAQIGVEDLVKYMDEHFDPESSSRVKLLYIESIEKPGMLLKHASSLIRKGCRIAAIKAGASEAGSRAASSHTGAMTNSDVAVEALFKKAGIVRCYGREELTNIASIYMQKALPGKNIAIITHAGGPAVMLTDILSDNGLSVPPLNGPAADALSEKLYPGSSVSNPIDFLATGTADQLGDILDACENDFSQIDVMVVIFGSPGLFDVSNVYEVLHQKMEQFTKPVYPVLPSVINARQAIDNFLGYGHTYYPDEVNFGKALSKVLNTPAPITETVEMPLVDQQEIRNIIGKAEDGYLSASEIQQLLDAIGIDRANEYIAVDADTAVRYAGEIGYPVVMKVIGPLHKSDAGGVALHVTTEADVIEEFNRLMQIENARGVLIAEKLSGTEIFIGAQEESRFGHIVLAGLGGVFVEVLKDISYALAPVSKNEALSMIQQLNGYKLIKGARSHDPVNEDLFADAIMRVAALVRIAPEIKEMDLNPLLGGKEHITAVDYRIRIKHQG